VSIVQKIEEDQLIFYSPTQYVLYKYKLTYVIYLIYLFIYLLNLNVNLLKENAFEFLKFLNKEKVTNPLYSKMRTNIVLDEPSNKHLFKESVIRYNIIMLSYILMLLFYFINDHIIL